jgi:hypothetical protein
MGLLCLKACQSDVDNAEECSSGGPFCAQQHYQREGRDILLTYRLQSEGHITELTPRCTFIFDKLLLHGALIHESSPTLMLTGQKDVLEEGTSVLSCHGEGPFYSPDAQMHLHMSLHGALMLEGPPILMLKGQKDVLVEGPSVLNCHGEGSIVAHLMPRCMSFTCRCMVL